MNRYLTLLLAGVVISSQAKNMYTFKDSNGQVLLTNVVNNGKASKAINHAEAEASKSEKQDDGGEYYPIDVRSDIEVLKQQAQQREDRLANLAKKLSSQSITETFNLPKYSEWQNMTDKQILQSVENPTDKDGNPAELSDYEKQKNLQYAKEYIYERNLAKKPAAKIGMTKNQVRNHTNWGEPNSINKTITAQGTFEQWVYDDFQYLYFKNGKLTTIQTHE